MLTEGGRSIIWRAVTWALKRYVGKPVLLVGDERWAYFPRPLRHAKWSPGMVDVEADQKLSYSEIMTLIDDIAAEVSLEVEGEIARQASEPPANVRIACPECGAIIITSPYGLISSSCHSCEHEFEAEGLPEPPPTRRFSVIEGGASGGEEAEPDGDVGRDLAEDGSAAEASGVGGVRPGDLRGASVPAPSADRDEEV